MNTVEIRQQNLLSLGGEPSKIRSHTEYGNEKQSLNPLIF
jgi:hypothetical protein